MTKIKVFLGGYINYMNAQNINCKSVANHLDKGKFQVYALTAYFGNSEKFDIKTFYCFRPFRLTKYLGFIWGVLRCNIIYLPKHVDTPTWILKLARFLNKPTFSTIEGNVTDTSLPNLINLFGSEDKTKRHFSFINKLFAITNFIKKKTSTFIKIEDSILQLGVNTNCFIACRKSKLTSIVFVGSLIKRKQVQEFIELGRVYPQLCFNIIGDGVERQYLQEKSSKNIIFHGSLSHASINEVFRLSDLMFLPSRSEGFPKVILEAASAGIPSIVYNSYGASDWIKDHDNGFVVNDISDVKQVIDELIERPDILKEISVNAIKLAENFDWKFVISSWEEVIEDLFYER